jgi:hypothetical protein
VGTAVDGSSAGCTSYLRVVDNQNPTIQCQAETFECTGNQSATVTPVATCSDNCSCTTSCVTATFPLGTSQDGCSASDPSGNTASCQDTVTVVDTTPPVVTLTGSPSLWPPNDRFVSFDVSEAFSSILDTCFGPLSPDASVRLVSIYSDELDRDAIVITSATTFRVESDRRGWGNGRVYGVTMDVRDPSGNVARVLWKITVPHDRHHAAIDDGPEDGFIVVSPF